MSNERRSAAPAARLGEEPSIAGGAHRSPRREVTRERVLDAARDVFAERGVFGGTVEDICARAGFTRGAFYSNFADKDDVLRALIAREHARWLASLEANVELLEPSVVTEVETDPTGTLAAIAERLLRSVPTDRRFSLIQAELELHAVRDPAVARLFLEADARLRARISEFLERGLGRLHRELVVDLADVTDAVIAIVVASTRRALLDGPGSDPNALARAVLPPLIVAVSRADEDGAGARSG